jgi:hypothetical protein
LSFLNFFLKLNNNIIKETVRKAAQVALRTLGGLTVRLSDPNYTSKQQAKETLEIALPFLLDKGMFSLV